MYSVKNVMIIGSFGNGAIESYYKNGFEKLGVHTATYASGDQYFDTIGKNIVNKLVNKVSPVIFYEKINSQLLSFIKGKKYDVILVFKGMELYEETIEHLRTHAGLLANYNCDHPFKFYSPGSGNVNVLNSIKHYDVLFSYSSKITSQLKENYHKQAYRIPFGYDSSNTGILNCDTDTFKNKILFIGAYDKERAAMFGQLNDVAIQIYGDAKWKTRNVLQPSVAKAWQKRSLYGNEYVCATKNALGIINLLRKQNVDEDSHNMRTFEVPGYGGLLISERTGEQLEFFEEDKEAVYFSSVDELTEKLKFLRQYPSASETIRKAGHAKSILCNYSYDHRSREMLTHLSALLK